MNRKLNSTLKFFVVKSFAALLIVGMMHSAAFSQTRIVFPRGRSETTVSGSISWRGAHSYIVNASKGQKMTVRTSSENASVRADVGGDNIGKNRTIEIAADGDYVITIHNDGGETNFSLFIAVR